MSGKRRENGDRSDEGFYSAIAEEFAPIYGLQELLDRRNWAARVAKALGRVEDTGWFVHARCPERMLDCASLRSLWEKSVAGEKGRETLLDLHFYVHIPFCRKICRYCCYYKRPVLQGKELEEYLDWLSGAFEFFSPAFTGRSFQTLYFGGGTPSILNAGQLDRMLGELFGRFSFDERGQKTFELNPDSLDAAKLKILSARGFNRISLGVQSLRQDILSNENRGYQTGAMVTQAITRVKEQDSFVLNVDLLLGMKGDTRKSFLETLEAVMALGPDQIKIHPIQPTEPYLKAGYQGSAQRYYHDLDRRYRSVTDVLPDMIAKYGYEGLKSPRIDDYDWSFSKPTRNRFTAYYDDGVWSEAPEPRFALGPGARARIAGALDYEQQGPPGSRFDPQEKIWSGLGLGWRDEMVKFVLMTVWKDEPVSRSRFKELFGKELMEVFGPELESMESQGAVRTEGDLVHFPIRDKKRLFICSLRLLKSREMAADLYAGDFSLIKERGRLRFRIELTRPNARYETTAGGLGLLIPKIDRKAFPPEVSALLTELFKKMAASPAKPEMPRFAREFRGKLSKLLPKLEKIALEPPAGGSPGGRNA